MADDLEQFFSRLAHAVYAAGPAFAVQPVEVAQITSRWAPYSALRRELSIPTNEDYELLVMRLLSGEGNYVFADESLQDDLKREVASVNPDLTALRTYGAARITLARDALCRVLGIRADELPAAPAPVIKPSRESAQQRAAVAYPTAPVADVRASQPAACQFCGETLPPGRAVNFCPHCGLNVMTRRCPGCSAEVQPGWRYCVTCGRAVGHK